MLRELANSPIAVPSIVLLGAIGVAVNVKDATKPNKPCIFDRITALGVYAAVQVLGLPMRYEAGGIPRNPLEEAWMFWAAWTCLAIIAGAFATHIRRRWFGS